MNNCFFMNMGGSGAELTQDERAELRRVIGSIKLSPQRIEEICQRIQERRAKRNNREEVR